MAYNNAGTDTKHLKTAGTVTWLPICRQAQVPGVFEPNTDRQKQS